MFSSKIYKNEFYFGKFFCSQNGKTGFEDYSQPNLFSELFCFNYEVWLRQSVFRDFSLNFWWLTIFNFELWNQTFFECKVGTSIFLRSMSFLRLIFFILHVTVKKTREIGEFLSKVFKLRLNVFVVLICQGRKRMWPPNLSWHYFHVKIRKTHQFNNFQC